MVYSNKKFCIKTVDEARDLVCFNKDVRCVGSDCNAWTAIDGKVGYCSLIESTLKNKQFDLDNVDRKTLLTFDRVKEEYKSNCVRECNANQCMGWIDCDEHMGFCIKDHLIGEKYTTGVVEGATNFLKIKRVWDNSFNMILCLMKEVTERLESNFNPEEISYLITLMVKDIYSEISKDEGKRDLFFVLKNLVRLDMDGGVIDLDDDFLDFMFLTMAMGTAMNRFLFAQDMAELLAD